MASAPASTSAPEWVVEALGLWAPRVHVPVDAISMPGVQGRRARLAAFLEKLLTRAPAARRVGPIDDALKRVSLDGLRPTQAVDDRRLVMALLTACRPAELRRPLGVHRDARRVDALVGVAAEEVALGLNEVRRAARRGERVVPGQRGGETGNGDASQ